MIASMDEGLTMLISYLIYFDNLRGASDQRLS